MRHPIHVLYGGAHLFRAGLGAKLAKIALAALDHAPSELGAEEILERVRLKLQREPVEDYRIDFEDGYGVRSDQEEDATAKSTGKQLAEALAAKDALPPFLGIRVKRAADRGSRTLNLFLESAGALPEKFVVTLPKVETPGEVEDFRRAFPSIDIELMIETPQALNAIEQLLDAAEGALAAVHFGPYDFLSSCGVPGPSQSLSHALCDHARLKLVTHLAPRSVRLSDGPTSFLPIGGSQEISEARQLHRKHVLEALNCGIYQGWDLHPAQLPVRYAALYSYYREHLPAQRARLLNYRASQAQATRIGATFDDAATVRGLELFFERAHNCGAINDEEYGEISH